MSRRLATSAILALGLCACGGDGGGGTAGAPTDSVPSFGSSSIGDQSFTQNEMISELTLPEATGGNPPLTYGISPSLPAGLRFDATRRVLSGTPGAPQEAITYTYKVTDSDAADPDSATLTFSISVSRPREISLSLVSSLDSINEWEDNKAATLTLAINDAHAASSDSPTSSGTRITLDSTGSAILGSDFDIEGLNEAMEVVIPSGEERVQMRLTPIRDLVAEGNESIELSVQAVDGSAVTGDGDVSRITIVDTGAPIKVPETEEKFALLSGTLAEVATATEIELFVEVYNDGTKASSATTGKVIAKTSADATNGIAAQPANFDVPALDPSGEPFSTIVQFPLSNLSASQNYYFALEVSRTAEELEAEPDEPAPDERFMTDLHVTAEKLVRATCEGFTRPEAGAGTDPLFDDQWGLKNTGQASYAQSGGAVGEDLNMETTLQDGPTGQGVQIAVVDSGLEICHPDLKNNVASGASYNFLSDKFHGARKDDPFLPQLTLGDHGTSVAGIIAMQANNGIGGRGIAPDASIRGYNLLEIFKYLGQDTTLDAEQAEIDALGMSSSNPNSSDAHIFNMSYGSAEGASILGRDKLNAFKTGVTRLRTKADSTDALGAIYVLAAGNAFDECADILPITDDKSGALYPNLEIGCTSANLDPESAYPYVMSVGAFNADGERSSYSSVGASLWVVAPGGEDYFEKPAAISADQMGRDRGYAVYELDEVPQSAVDNPDGDYTLSFGGTSAAAPYASGAVALLLEAEPNLTWRDVKHILAKTARQMDADIPRVRIAFGGSPVILQHAWITNAAGYRFHNWFGFGAIDVDAAIAMAKRITPDSLGSFAESDASRQANTTSIPDHDGAGVTLTQSVSGFSANTNIEAVQLHIEATHTRFTDLNLTLTAPSGTSSVINHAFNQVLAEHPSETLEWKLISNAFYGEAPNGDWQLKVVDAASGETGQLDAWSLVFFTGEHP